MSLLVVLSDRACEVPSAPGKIPSLIQGRQDERLPIFRYQLCSQCAVLGRFFKGYDFGGLKSNYLTSYLFYKPLPY